MVRFKVLFTILFACGISFQNYLSAQTSQNKKLVMIMDPGHGGRDSGAVGINGIQEKDVVLKIAKQIVKLNNTIFKNRHEIYLTRYKDTLIYLGDRTRLAKTLKADLFLSLHCNFSENPNARGVEVYVSEKQDKYSRKSILFAYGIQNTLRKHLGIERRGVKFEDFQVLRETANYCPSALLELGFLSNWDEADYFSKENNVKACSMLILTALQNHLNF
ncbi:MAG: N-acetylmuramoyl-L-alanine amidase [bacterium]|nr:N-acetylmuramoyl-L-alanine amidase [bacterium]